MSKKFGTFKGVFVPSTEAILGTVLFLLMPLLTADVGLGPMLGIVLLAHSVTLATAFSLSDCATNLNRISGGGMYALSKQSLGNAMGGSIGIMLYLAQAASIGFYSIGFAEPLHSLLAPGLAAYFPFFSLEDPASVLIQRQLIATFFMLIFFVVVMIGADFTLKLQTVILFVLMASIITILAAPAMKLSYQGRPVFSGGFNMSGNRPLTLGIFFMTFTQFFPAVTGISTGIGMSGDLKDPRTSIVRGTFSAILITMCVYMGALFVFASVDRSLILTGYSDGNPSGVILTELFGLDNPFPSRLPGLMILLGVLFATCSSALSVFMTGPRTLQYLARDGILPDALLFLKKDFKKGGTEPRYAIILSFFIGLAVVWMGSINFASMVVGILFLVVYGWVNGAAFLERISKNPAFRPTFKGHWTVSLYGFLACIGAICLFNWKAGILIFLSQYLMFRLILKYKSNGKLEGVWWGFIFSRISISLKRIRKIVQGSRNWRPVLSSFAFADNAEDTAAVIRLSEQIASFQGLVSCNIFKNVKSAETEIFPERESGIPISVIKTVNPTESLITLLQSGNPTGISVNTILAAYTTRIDTVRVIAKVLEQQQNLLLYKSGKKVQGTMRIDIWWRGERNGNLMMLLAFIINRYQRENRYSPYDIRIIRRLDRMQGRTEATEEISELLRLSRIEGEIVVLDWSEENFLDVLRANSEGASLVMLGLPGNYQDRKSGVFKLNEIFFDREIQSYRDLPPILFVKSYAFMSLIED